jgi:hypothetical protein
MLTMQAASSASSAPKTREVNGMVMAAETNKPVAGASISFFAQSDKGPTPTPVAKTISDATGAFRVRLAPGSYTWLVRADGFGLFEGGAAINAKQPELEKLAAYLNKPAELSGRLMDGGGAPLPGLTIVASRWRQAVTGPDGRFRLGGLSPRGYELSLRPSGRVLEKSSYLYLNAAEAKELGDLVVRRASTIQVTVIPRKEGEVQKLGRIGVSLNGPAMYRSSATDGRGIATLADLPPGHYSLNTSDERLQEGRQEVEIAEGERREVTLEADIKPPSLRIEEYGDVFLPNRPLKVRARGLWVEKAEAVVFSVSGETLVSGAVDLHRPADILLGSLKKVTTIPVSFTGRRGSYGRSARISLPGLAPGAYLLELSGNGAQARLGFLVTRLGLIAKTSPNGTLLFATDLISGTALPGVEITSLPSGSTVKSGPDGLVAGAGVSGQQRLVGRNGDSLAFLELAANEQGSKPGALKGYLYTDRPAYRPGQTVFFKGVVRQRAGEDYRLPKLETVHVAVSDSGDKNVCESEATVTAAGSFQGECVLPVAPALGGYTISAAGNGETWQGWFQVLEYRKPEFEVTQTPDRRFLVAGDTAQVRLSARYYFDAPVAGAKVNWRIYCQPAWGLGPDSDPSGGSDADDEHDSGGYSDFIGEGELRLDDNGEGVVPVTARPNDMPFTYTIEADVIDLSSRKVSSSGSLTVVPSLVALRVKADSYLTKPGQTVDLTVRAADWEGAPRALPVRIAFQRQVYDKKSRTYSWTTAHTDNVTTAGDGSARTSFTFPQAGYWQVKAEAADQAGRKSVATASVWVWKEGYDWQGSFRELEAEFDRKSYKPGETARLIVRSPLIGGSLLLSLEGRDILSRRVVPLTSMVQVVELPVTNAYAPMVHVSAVTVGNGRFFSRNLPLRVDYQPGKLALTVKPDKPVYAPGDRVRLTLTSSVANKPVPAELSLAVVDEAIFAVAPERKDDIYQFFRGNREHLVTTLHSFPRVYLGGAAKDAAFKEKEDGLKGLKVRKVFKDTAFWMPMVSSNADGSTTAEFTLPDNLTTWRATTMGHTLASEFGSAREKFIARLDLMARLTPPRFLTAGDEVIVPGIITSMADRQQNVSGRFEATGLTLLGEAAFSGSIAPRDTLRRDMPVRADHSGSATLRLLAQGVDGATKRGDAMELTLPVLDRGIKRSAGGGIVLRDQEGETELALPDNAMAGSAQLNVTFSPTIASGLNSALTRLVDFPYGCVEQTLSRFIPAVYAQSLLKHQAWQPDAETNAKLPKVISEGMQRLADMQHEDGGWGWWKNDQTSLTMTAHALYGLGLARQAGVDVPQEMVQRGLKTLESLTRNAPTEELPRAYRAMAINGTRNEALEQRVTRAWKTLPVAEQLAFTEALGFAGHKEAARPLLDGLKQRVQSEGTAAYILDEAAESWWYGWRWGSSAVETTASLLSQLVRERADDPLAPRLAEFLARRQSGGWWQTTTSSAAAVTALADYVGATGEAGGAYTARLTLNGIELAAYLVEGGHVTSGPKQLTIPATALKNGVNRLKLTKDGSGVAYLGVSLEYVVPPEAAQSATGLKLERSLYRVTSVKDKDKWRREYTPLKPGEPLATGDDIEVRLTVDNQKALEYVIVEDRLPAGFESRETDRDPRFMDESAYLDWYTQRERHDERMAFFITTLPAGRHEFRYIIYPELSGRVIALPAAVWPMYQPELRGESMPWSMEIQQTK